MSLWWYNWHRYLFYPPSDTPHRVQVEWPRFLAAAPPADESFGHFRSNGGQGRYLLRYPWKWRKITRKAGNHYDRITLHHQNQSENVGDTLTWPNVLYVYWQIFKCQPKIRGSHLDISEHCAMSLNRKVSNISVSFPSLSCNYYYAIMYLLKKN